MMRGPADRHSDTPSPDDCAKSDCLRGRRLDCSVQAKNGPQLAPSSVNSELTKSAHGRAADQDEGSSGHHVGLDRRLPSHGGDFKPKQKGRRIKLYLIRRPFPFPRSTRSALQSEEYGHPRGHLARHATVTHLSAVRPGATDGGPRKQSTPRRPSVYGGRRCGSCRRSVREDHSRESPATGGPAPDTRPTHRLDRSTCRQGEQQLALEEGAAMPRRRP